MPPVFQIQPVLNTQPPAFQIRGVLNGQMFEYNLGDSQATRTFLQAMQANTMDQWYGAQVAAAGADAQAVAEVEGQMQSIQHLLQSANSLQYLNGIFFEAPGGSSLADAIGDSEITNVDIGPDADESLATSLEDLIALLP